MNTVKVSLKARIVAKLLGVRVFNLVVFSGVAKGVLDTRSLEDM